MLFCMASALASRHGNQLQLPGAFMEFLEQLPQRYRKVYDGSPLTLATWRKKKGAGQLNKYKQERLDSKMTFAARLGMDHDTAVPGLEGRASSAG